MLVCKAVIVSPANESVPRGGMEQPGTEAVSQHECGGGQKCQKSAQQCTKDAASASQLLCIYPENEAVIMRGDFVYANDAAGSQKLAQITSEFWWDEKADSKNCLQITEKVSAEEMLSMGWNLFAPVRILYNAELAFVRIQDKALPIGAKVVAATEHGNEIAQILQRPHALRDGETQENEIPLIRVASEEDIALSKRNEEYSESAWTICREKIDKHKLPMNLVKTHALLEGNKILFFFTSDGRVDFRALAKDLASVFHTRIELRQIGVRDRSQLIGGCGVCGLILCCHSCKAMVQSVSIKMAKKQNLALNSSKISGVCGKLLCCLSYEYATDEDVNKLYPRIGAKVWLGENKGVVKDVNMQTGIIRVMTDDHQYHDISNDQFMTNKLPGKKHFPPSDTETEAPQ
jgi:cell fate regulator YaaT (PSP1 superfamily)